MGFASILGAIGSIGSSLASGLYSLYQDKRDYEYKVNLQNQVFEREDSAVQRRVADLEAAGLNKNLAAGSAANSGSVVSSSSKDVNLGGALDGLAALSQIKAVNAQTENYRKQNELLKKQIEVANVDAMKARRENALDEMHTEWLLGSNGFQRQSGTAWDYSFKENSDFYKSPLFQMWFNDLENNRNSAHILETQSEWANANQVLNAAGTVGGKLLWKR